MPKINKSLQQKSSARLAAVQVLYHRKMMNATQAPQKLIADVLTQWEIQRENPNEDWDANPLPEQSLLTQLVEGVLANEESLSAQLQSVIKENWKPSRMSPILIAILECAAWEIQHKPERKNHIILDEYTALTHAFFDDPELGYMHSALQQLLQQLRPSSDG